MILEDKIDKALGEEESKKFLLSNLETIRGNILDSEKRISKKLFLVISFIALSELINQGIVTKISFFATENDLLTMAKKHRGFGGKLQVLSFE
jgi:hypothetical protein